MTLTLAMDGCAVGLSTGGAVLSAREIDEHGVRAFPASRGKTFRAGVGALKTLGYEITFSDEAAGVIKTAPRLIRTQTNVVGTRNAATGVTHGFARSYTLTLSSESKGTKVRAVPRVFADAQEISERDVWDLPGERALWSQLFSEIASSL